MIDKARQFALHAHGDQRYGDQPYAVHLDAVAAVPDHYGETAQVIGLLHDVIEDTSVTYETVRAQFGEYIADCVAVLTDEPGGTRSERKLKTNQKMLQTAGSLELALIVKAADRLANVRACLNNCDERRLKMYRDEHQQFRNAVYREGLCDEFWDDLERHLDLTLAPANQL